MSTERTLTDFVRALRSAEVDVSPSEAIDAARAMARIADRVPDLKSPAAQASARLGLPRSFPWRSRRTQARWLARAGWPGKAVAAP